MFAALIVFALSLLPDDSALLTQIERLLDRLLFDLRKNDGLPFVLISPLCYGLALPEGCGFEIQACLLLSLPMTSPIGAHVMAN